MLSLRIESVYELTLLPFIKPLLFIGENHKVISDLMIMENQYNERIWNEKPCRTGCTNHIDVSDRGPEILKMIAIFSTIVLRPERWSLEMQRKFFEM